MNYGINIKYIDNIAVIELNYNKSNAINLEFVKDYMAIYSQLNKNQPIIIKGNNNFFSSGLDLVYTQSLNLLEMRNFISQFQDLLLFSINHNAPVVSILTGHVVAGGFLLASSTDARFGNVKDFYVGMNETVLGISLPPAPIIILNTLYGNNTSKILGAKSFYKPKQMVDLQFFNSLNIDPMYHAIQFIHDVIDEDKFYEEKLVRKNIINKYMTENSEHVLDIFLKDWFAESSILKRNNVIQSIKNKRSRN